jgi:hypothetical protein
MVQVMSIAVARPAGEAVLTNVPAADCKPPPKQGAQRAAASHGSAAVFSFPVTFGDFRGQPLLPVRCRIPADVKKSLNRNGRGFGWGIAHAAVSRRPPISLDTIVPRTGGYTYAVGVWDLSIVQGPFSVAPCQTLESRFAFSWIRCRNTQAPPGRYHQNLPVSMSKSQVTFNASMF